MPIDAMFLEPMLGQFRKMARECTDKGASGDAYDRMMAALGRMEELGREMDDFGAYSAKLMTEGLQMNFSTAYGEVLAGAAQAASGGEGGGYDDAALLKQTLDAYREAVKRIREGTEQAKQMAGDAVTVNEVAALSKDELLIPPIEEAIKLGESGVSFPVFLRMMIEKGLDKAMEGAPALRSGLEYELGWARASAESPHHIAEKEAMLAKFDELAGKAAFGVPDSLEFELERKLIEHKHLPAKRLWSEITWRWEHMLMDLSQWALAHTPAAPVIDPWKLIKPPRPAIERDKDCIPGFLKEKIRIFKENFGLDFADIFKHETFEWMVRHFRMDYSQEWVEFLIEKVHPACVPLKHLAQDLIDQAMELHTGKLIANPERHRVGEAITTYYDSVFGEGAMAKKAPPWESNDSKAAPWDWAAFSHGK